MLAACRYCLLYLFIYMDFIYICTIYIYALYIYALYITAIQTKDDQNLNSTAIHPPSTVTCTLPSPVVNALHSQWVRGVEKDLSKAAAQPRIHMANTKRESESLSSQSTTDNYMCKQSSNFHPAFPVASPFVPSLPPRPTSLPLRPTLSFILAPPHIITISPPLLPSVAAHNSSRRDCLHQRKPKTRASTPASDERHQPYSPPELFLLPRRTLLFGGTTRQKRSATAWRQLADHDERAGCHQ